MNLKLSHFKCVCACSLLSCMFLSKQGRAQDVTSPRFFKLNFQRLSAPNRLISQEGDAFSAEDAESNYIAEAQLLLPIKLKGRTKFIGQLDYDREAVFGLSVNGREEGEDFNFNNFAAAVIVRHQINDQLSYFSRIKVENGSENIFPIDGKALAANFSHFLERTTENGSYGLGFQVSYNRRITVLPILKYGRDFASGWGIDISLPQRILVNKRFSQSNLFYAGLKGSRSNYLFRDGLEDISTDLYYRRITVNAVLGVEKQISSLFGLMLEVGATRPLRSGVYSFDNNQWTKLHDFNEDFAPYVKFGLFLSINKSSL